MKLVSKHDLERWGNEAATEYLHNQTPLNHTVEKIASENNLNADQVKRVCEFANITTNLSLFEKMADKRFKFDQADASQVMRKMAAGDATEKVAGMARQAYSMSVPDELKRRNTTAYQDIREIGSEKIAHIASASRDAEDPDQLLKLLEAKTAALEELKMDKFAADALVANAEDQIYEEMKSRVLGGDNTFGEFCAAALSHGKTASDKGTIKEALLKAAYRLVENTGADQYLTDTMAETHNGGVSKTAAVKLAGAVPDEYIADEFDSPGVPFVVRNGNMNLYFTLDTLVKQKDKSCGMNRPLLLLDDDVRYIKRKLTA